MQIAAADLLAESELLPVWKERYDMLDGWRGLAAIFVVLHHVSDIKFGAEGVMAFFVISGYCITAAYEAALRKGMSFGQFMFRRVRRIYPPYLLSLAFFALTRTVKASTGLGTFHRPLLEWIQNVTMTQWFSLVRHPLGHAYENKTLFVDAYWSLNYEEQFYLIVALLIASSAFVNRRVMLALITIGAVFYNLIPHQPIHGIFIEYWPHFAIGSLLFYRLCRMPGATMRRFTDLALATVAILYGAMAWQNRGYEFVIRPVNYEMFIAATFALLLIAIRPLNDRFKVSHIGRVLMRLGLISYSLYLINQFNVIPVKAIAGYVVPAGAPDALRTIVEVMAEMTIATVFWYACERPFLNRPIVPAAEPLAPTVALA